MHRAVRDRQALDPARLDRCGGAGCDPPPMHPALLTALLALSAPTLVAQNRWVVDSLNRPGATHATLNAAVAASSPGDHIRVRDGANSVIGLVIDKPLR